MEYLITDMCEYQYAPLPMEAVVKCAYDVFALANGKPQLQEQEATQLVADGRKESANTRFPHMVAIRKIKGNPVDVVFRDKMLDMFPLLNVYGDDFIQNVAAKLEAMKEQNLAYKFAKDSVTKFNVK